MSAPVATLAVASHLAQSSLATGRPTGALALDVDAADWLDRQRGLVLARQVAPGQYVISPRVRK